MQKRSAQISEAGRQDMVRFAYGKNRRSVISWMRQTARRMRVVRGKNKEGAAVKYGSAVKNDMKRRI